MAGFTGSSSSLISAFRRMHPEASQARHCDLYAKVIMLQSERVSEHSAFLN